MVSVSTVTADNARVTITLNVTVYEPSYITLSGDQKREHDHPDRYRACMDEGYGKPLGHPVISTENHAAQLDGIDEVLHGNLCRFLLQRLNADRQHIKQDRHGATTTANSAPTIVDSPMPTATTTKKNLTGNDQLFVQNYSTSQGYAGNGNCKKRCQYFQLHSFLQRAVIL